MEKEDDYPVGFTGLDYPLAIGESSDTNNNQQQENQMLSFADVMQFADFGPKLLSNATNKNMVNDHHHHNNNTSGSNNNGNMDPVYFLKFSVLNDKLGEGEEECEEIGEGENNVMEEEGGGDKKRGLVVAEMKNNNKRKRGRSMKTSEEVESQRMTHIAVERNRRKQMNEHLRVLRSLMPGSYVQRGDQASIIGGAIEFVRELEQLLQCLESQKRRRLYGDEQRPIGVDSNNQIPSTNNQQVPFIYPDQVEFDTGLVREETAQNKSGLADVEVKLLGFDGIIKVLSRRRQGQLIKTIAALEDLQLHILHTNITTIEQTVLYSFNVKMAAESRFSAEDIASSVQQIFTFIHASSI